MMPREVEGGRTARQLTIEIEPDLRLLNGLLTVLRYLGARDASDMIDPAAIAAITIPAEEAVDRIMAMRRNICLGRGT